MKKTREKRRAVAALLVSAALHGLALWLVPMPQPSEERVVRVRFPVEPLNALQLHTRVAAISHVPSFNLELPCYSNRLYVNAIVFGLIQQSRMGGRYLSGKKE